MQDKNTLILGLIVLVLIVGLAVYRLQQSTSAGAPGVSGGGRPAPDVATKTLDGQPWRLRDQKGKVVLVDFWATWCGPCVASLPHMKKVYDQFKANPDFVMVGVSGDYDAATLRNFLQRQQIPWLQLYDPAQPFMNAFGINAIPSVWVIGRESQIVGAQLDGEAVEKTVAAELARK